MTERLHPDAPATHPPGTPGGVHRCPATPGAERSDAPDSSYVNWRVLAHGHPARRAPFVRTLLAALLLVLGVIAGCKSEKPKPSFEAGAVDMKLGSKTFRLAVADTPRARRYGLMHRDSMPADRGMIFVFPEEEESTFHMENTFIPLDLIYVNEAGRVVKIMPMGAQERDEKGKLRQFPSDVPIKYAIELNLGAAAAAGLKVGDTVEIPAGARAAE